MSRDHQSEYQIALTEFDKIRRQETRTSQSGQDFILVDNVTKRLTSENESCPKGYDHLLDCLGQTAYLQFDSGPPPMKKHYYDDILPVFYTLLDIRAPSCVHLFKNFGHDTLPIGLDVLRRDIKFPWRHDDFHKRFHERQLAWCPIPFDLEMGRAFRDRICPFLRKEEIAPYRSGKGPRHNTAILYAIDIPEEVVEPRLQSLMASARVERQHKVPEGSISHGNIYRFALKQFKPQQHLYGHFENEKNMFLHLQKEDGMIRYIGWFQSFERVGEGKARQYHNIVLELADFDFYHAILKEAPPISFEEIQGFWESMSEISRTLASIHTVVIKPHSYLTRHGDIKPENILRVKDRFKLADPGEASMHLKSADKSPVAQAKWSGGTRTYAAPEKAAYFDEPGNKDQEITPQSDVWSFGCVLSIAATYVVLGNQGFLIYTELRRKATYLAKEESIDVFHDGKGVLPSVTQWHHYLREAVRKTDPFTVAVLDMVDNHMLVARDRRWEARLVQEEFRKILAHCQDMQSRVPTELVDLIQDIDLQAERHYDQNSGRTRRLPPTEIEFESQSALLSEPIQPTAQRSRKVNGSPFQTPHQAFSIPSITNIGQTGAYPLQEQVWTNFQRRDTMTSPLSQSTQTRISNPLPESTHRGMKVGQVKHLLKKTGLTYKPQVTSLSSLFSRQQTTVRDITPDTEELEYLDQRLKEEFEGRDIVFLVDNGSTMSTWWTSATELLEVLVWRALGYDDDGMELYFTNPDTNPNAIIDSTKAKSVKKKVKKYTEAMAKAEPERAGPKACNTTILPELERIINDYARAKSSKNEPRKKTIIVLTDGLWPGMHDEYTLDLYLRSAFHGLKDLHGDVTYIEAGHAYNRQDISALRPVTIQFVQFGDDDKARERLRRLDDDMTSWTCPDLIDTEDADGDIYKMFLGSLCQDIDRRMRHSLRLSPPTTINNSAGVEGYINRLSLQHNSLINSPVDSVSQVPGSPFTNSQANYSSWHHSQLANPPSPYHERPQLRQSDSRNPSNPGSASLERASTIRTQNSNSREGWPPEGMVSYDSYPPAPQPHAGPSRQSTRQYHSQYPHHRDNC